MHWLSAPEASWTWPGHRNLPEPDTGNFRNLMWEPHHLSCKPHRKLTRELEHTGAYLMTPLAQLRVSSWQAFAQFALVFHRGTAQALQHGTSSVTLSTTLGHSWTNMNQQYQPWVQITNKIRQLRCIRWVPQPVALSPDNWTMICQMLDITRFRTRTIWRRHSQMQQLRENCHLRTKTYLYILSTILNHLGTFEWQTMKPPATYWYHGPVKDFVPELVIPTHVGLSTSGTTPIQPTQTCRPRAKFWNKFQHSASPRTTTFTSRKICFLNENCHESLSLEPLPTKRTKKSRRTKPLPCHRQIPVQPSLGRVDCHLVRVVQPDRDAMWTHWGNESGHLWD